MGFGVYYAGMKGLILIKKNLKAVVGIIVVGIILVLVFKPFGNKQQEAQFQTAQAEKGTLISAVSASGQMLTANIVNVTTSVSGLIKAVYVKNGDRVFSGQKIMELTLDPVSQQKSAAAYSSYLSSKNSLDLANSTMYTLQSQMFAANQKFINDAVARNLATTDPTYIQQSADWLAAEAKYKNQKAVINQAQNAVYSSWISYQQSSPIIYAPMAGVISNITVVSGMTIAGVDSGTRVAVIKSEGKPLASFNISEIDVSKVKVGQKATITIDSISDKTFTGKVLTVDLIGTVTSNVTNYPVVIGLETEVPQALPNMAVSAKIIIDMKDNVLLVPNGAIVKQGDQTMVRVIKDNKEQMTEVEVGLSNDTQTEIISGVSEGELVVTSVSNSTTTRSQGQNNSPFGVFGGNRGFGGGGNIRIQGR